MKRSSLIILACASLVCPPSQADEPLKRHGAVIASDKTVQVEGGFTATLQSSSDSRIKNEFLSSFDLVSTMPSGLGNWTAYIEGNLSPRQNGLSTQLVEVNADAGSALDRDNKGRLQVSELHYSHPFGENTLTLGLLNPACVLDSSEVANDETRQFLSSHFVNNPTIAFPDYALGTCIHFEEGKTRPGFNLLLSSSHGLADNPNRSYSELVDVTATGKGLFIGGELYGTSRNSRWHLGVWTSTTEHVRLDDSGNTQENYGAYLSIDQTFGDNKINLRIGAANEKVSETAGFISLAIETPVASHTLGIGIAKTMVSKAIQTDKDDTSQAEVYIRFDLHDKLHITPSVQQIQNSGFDNSASNFDKVLTVYSVRTSYNF